MEKFTYDAPHDGEEAAAPVSEPPGIDPRSVVAHFLMVLFIILPAVGFAFIEISYGLIAGGLTCGIYAYLLGSE